MSLATERAVAVAHDASYAGLVMLQSESDASIVRAHSAALRTKYVFAGKELALRQLETAGSERPVSSATACVPPRAITTAFAVLRGSDMPHDLLQEI